MRGGKGEGALGSQQTRAKAHNAVTETSGRGYGCLGRREMCSYRRPEARSTSVQANRAIKPGDPGLRHSQTEAAPAKLDRR